MGPGEASCEFHPWEHTATALEDALRFGYAARLRYAAEYPMWGDALESRLRLDWEAMFPDRRDEWKSDVEAMRFAWHHDPEN